MATIQRRERPRTMYATIHRSANDTPFLYLKPVIHSLTDGTSIPPPQEIDFYSSPPTSPLKSISKYSPFPSASSYGQQTIFGGPAQTYLGGGPLSSHPVSPCTSPSSGTSPASFSIGSSSPSMIEDDEEEDSVFSDSRRNTWRSDRATIGNRQSRMYDWMPQPSIMEEERQTQRPRFVERFLKLRSGSTGRNSRFRMDGEAVPLVGPQAYSFEGDGRLKESRMGRIRRSASYSVNLGLNLHDSNVGTSSGVSDASKDEPKKRVYASNTFPRMARQKSMDLLSTVKRVSGSWWNHEDDSGASAAEVWDRLATAEELERGGTQYHKREKEGVEDDADAKTIVCPEPAPELPELESIGVELVGGKIGLTELFDEIGR